MKPKLKSFPTAERLITMFLPINPIKENRTNHRYYLNDDSSGFFIAPKLKKKKMFVKEVYFDSRPFFSADHLNRRES